MNQSAFGRRAGAKTAPVFGGAAIERTVPVGMPDAPAESHVQPRLLFDSSQTPEKSVDDELAEWKRSRRRVIPWRQISLMATLSLGIASLVLPDDVNEPVEWLVYALTAASMITTVAAWWKKLTHVV